MNFFDNVVNKSNAIFKERLNNPFGSVRLKPDETSETTTTTTTTSEKDGNQQLQGESATPCLESTARQQHLSSQDSGTSNNDQNSSDRNSQFAAMAADAEAVAQKAAKGAKNIGSFLFSMANKAGQTVSQTAKQVKQVVESTTILADLNREQQEFVRDHGGSMQPGDLPWDDCADETKAAYIREQILSLSQDKRNFVRSPPADSDFKFDAQSCYPQALSLIREDPNLNRVRHELVPKLVNEETFWCNYFYRVSMLKQMSEKGDRAKQGWASSRSSSGEGPDEMGINMTPHGTIDEPLSPGISANSANTTATVTTDPPQAPESFNFDKVSSQEQQQQQWQQTQETTNVTNVPNLQYQAQELESSESRKLFAEADDLKSKLRELNIGSFDNSNEEAERLDDAELQRDLLEFELISGTDVDNDYNDEQDEAILQREIMELTKGGEARDETKQGEK